MFIMKKQVIAAAVLCALTTGAAMAEQAKEGPWLVRARVVQLNSDNGGSTTPALGLSINDKVIPEVDFTYFFNKNLAAELILTVPQKHTLHSSALAADVGTLKHLPPTLTVQYHFDAGNFQPYVGAGLNYTRFSSVHLGSGASIDKDSVGGALQAGVDVPLGGGLYFNVDVKKVYISTDVALNGAKIGTFKVDPLLVGVGLGWRF
jgi:outer membrane protein